MQVVQKIKPLQNKKNEIQFQLLLHYHSLNSKLNLDAGYRYYVQQYFAFLADMNPGSFSKKSQWQRRPCSVCWPLNDRECHIIVVSTKYLCVCVCVYLPAMLVSRVGGHPGRCRRHESGRRPAGHRSNAVTAVVVPLDRATGRPSSRQRRRPAKYDKRRRRPRRRTRNDGRWSRNWTCTFADPLSSADCMCPQPYRK